MRSLSQAEETQVVTSVAGSCGQVMADIMTVTHKLRSSEDASLRSVATNLSTRQLLRLARRLNKYPDETASNLINKACLGRFLPALAKDSLDKLVDRMLNLLNKPREYIQLNRDTTVQTLTLQPTVREGVIVYDDSPLVQAAKTS